MANTIKHKRSSTPSATPSTSDLELGELAVNTYDGKLFLKKDDGSASVVEIGAGGGGGATTLDGLTDVTITSASTGEFLKYNGSDWVNSSLPEASSSVAGIVTTGTQTFAGKKTHTTSSASDTPLTITRPASADNYGLVVRNSSNMRLVGIGRDINYSGGHNYDSSVSSALIEIGSAQYDHATLAFNATQNTLSIMSKSAFNVLELVPENGGYGLTKLTVVRAPSFTANVGKWNFNVEYPTGSASAINFNAYTGVSVNLADADALEGSFHVKSNAATRKGVIVQAHASQTANLFEAQDSSGTTLFSVDKDGSVADGTVPVARVTGLATVATSGDYDDLTNKPAIGGSPSGAVIAFAGASAPSGWLLCDGSAVSRSTYADLFTAISTNYGAGDGSTTFNVPDLRRRTPYGKGTSDSLGTSDGVAEGSRSLSHTHSVPAHYHGKGTLNITSSGTHTTSISHDHASFNATGYTGYDGAHTHGINSGETGGSGSNRYVLKSVGPTYITTAGGVQIIQTSATHRHSITLGVNVPSFSANSASTGAHTHASSSFSGSVGATGSGIDGDSEMTSGSATLPHLIMNYIIKT